MDYLNAMLEFMLYLEPLESIDYANSNLIFLSGSLTVNTLIILLDKAVHHLKGKSILGITYTGNRFLLSLFCWVFGATTISYFGLILDIFNTTIQSCAVIGFSWLYIFVGLVKKYSNPEIEQE